MQPIMEVTVGPSHRSRKWRTGRTRRGAATEVRRTGGIEFEKGGGNGIYKKKIEDRRTSRADGNARSTLRTNDKLKGRTRPTIHKWIG